jgi:8-oxo-dGTP pyrophosphatase MutT (NUDIX family)
MVTKEAYMKVLFTLDKQDYAPDQPVLEKISTRAVIIREGRIAMQKGKAGDYKLLGGGVEPGEDLKEALVREVREEAGLVVSPESIHAIGEVVERRRDAFEPDMVFVCHSHFFFCNAGREMVEPHLTESEMEKGYHLVWATAEQIIEGNRPFCDSQPWIFRDTEFIRRLSDRTISTLDSL